MSVTFTVDLEDPTTCYVPEGRYVILTQRILDLCDEFSCHATFFTVGRLAQAAPDLIREIATRGHEIAYHSHEHRSLTDETPAQLKQESHDDKDRLEQLAGQRVIGYRAPRYSLTPQTSWALEVLAENGFLYSSSVMPTSVSLFGFPHLPATPFRWPNGLIEFPLPVKKIGSVALPYLGGIYLYALPFWLTNKWQRQAQPEETLWTYAHPYDFDREESFTLMPNTPAWISGVLWCARRVAEKKIRRLLTNGVAANFSERLEDPSFSPPILDKIKP